MVGAAKNKLELLSGNADRLEDCRDDLLVVLSTVLDKLKRRLQVIKEAMDISEQDDDVALGTEQLSDLQSSEEVSNVRSSGSGGS